MQGGLEDSMKQLSMSEKTERTPSLPIQVLVDCVFKHCDASTKLNLRNVCKETRVCIPEPSTVRDEVWNINITKRVKWEDNIYWDERRTMTQAFRYYKKFENSPFDSDFKARIGESLKKVKWQRVVTVYGNVGKGCEVCGCSDAKTFLAYMYRMCNFCLKSHLFSYSKEMTVMLKVVTGETKSQLNESKNTLREFKAALGFLFSDSEKFDVWEAKKRLRIAYVKKQAEIDSKVSLEKIAAQARINELSRYLGVSVPDLEKRDYFSRFKKSRAKNPNWTHWRNNEEIWRARGAALPFNP